MIRRAIRRICSWLRIVRAWVVSCWCSIGVDHPADLLLAVLEEPVEVAPELLERLDPALFQPLDREQGDQADQRADPELVEPAVGVAEDVVEEAVLLVPERVIAVAHVLHGAGDQHVMLEELGRQRPRTSGSPSPAPGRSASGSGRTSPSSRWRRTARSTSRRNSASRSVDDRDVVEPEEPAFEDVVAFLVDLVHPPGEVEHQLVEAALEPLAVRPCPSECGPCCKPARRPRRGPAG